MRLPICPPATQDIRLNLRNRQAAINAAMYGPANPGLPNTEYWKRLADRWGIKPSEAKTMLCGNCGFFDVKPQTLACIAKGIGSQGIDPYDTIVQSGLGYCRAFQFKCAAKRTCSAWVTGGPIR